MKKLLIIIFFLPLFAIAQKKQTVTEKKDTSAIVAPNELPNQSKMLSIVMTLGEWQSLIVTLNNIGSKGFVVSLDPDIKNNIIIQLNKQLPPPAEPPKK